MNYKRIYREIIFNAREKYEFRKNDKENYYEKHHICPKSFGGKDTIKNIVIVTAKEHYILHWCLFKFSKGIKKSKMSYAWKYTCFGHKGQDKKYTSKEYERAKKNIFVTQETREKMSNSAKKRLENKENHPMWNKHHLEETKNKISETNKISCAGELNGFYNKHHTKETKNNIGAKNSLNNRKRYIIIHPNEKIEEVYGLRAFARKYNIAHNYLSYCAKGYRKEYKGYKCFYYDEYYKT